MYLTNAKFHSPVAYNQISKRIVNYERMRRANFTFVCQKKIRNPLLYEVYRQKDLNSDRISRFCLYFP